MVYPEGLPPTDSAGPETPPAPPPFWPPIPYENILADSLICRGPVLFWGLCVVAAVAVAAVVYDGVNATGRRITSVNVNGFGAPAPYLILSRPIVLYNGLFVSLSVAPSDCLVLFEPLPSS